MLLLGIRAAQATVFTVNSSLDNPDGNPGDELCDTGTPQSGTTGVCTLRAALEIAQPGDTIVFSSSVTVIRPLSPLPNVRCSIVGPQNSSVVIDGSFAGDSHGLRIEGAVASGAIISSLVINNFQRAGIYIAGHPVSGAPTGVIIEYCAIGTGASRNDGQGNGVGISIVGVNGVIIRDNVIADNTDAGIEVYSNFATGDYAHGMRITGNVIGMGAAETNFLGNGTGIILGQPPSQFLPGLNVLDCEIGGLGFGEQNVIAGNHGYEIVVQGDNFSGIANRIVGNIVGSDIFHLFDGGLGILLRSCDETVVYGNSIMGSRGHGIHITSVGNNRSSGNVIELNAIEGNHFDGIHIDEGSLLTRIGGEGAGNLISRNWNNGITIVGPTTTRHAIRENEIVGNFGLGIDLENDGVSQNRFLNPGTGPNLSQRAPEFLSIQRTNGTTIVRARVNSNLNPPFTVQFFGNTRCDPRGFGEGEFPLQIVTVPFSDRLDFTAIIPGEHYALTMTSTDNSGNTSEFSTCDMPGVVNSTEDLPDTDPGDGIAWTGHTLPDGRLEVTLRAAMEEAARTNRSFSTILFDIPGDGPHVIELTSPLPEITLPVAIDATSQPGYSAGNPKVEVSGAALGSGPFHGFNVLAGSTAIRGLAIVSFGGAGILVQGEGGSVIEANFIGLRTDGVTVGPISESGVHILNSTNNLIGGMNSAARNVITGNGTYGDGHANITIEGAGSEDNRVQGNYIGTDKTGGATPVAAKVADGVRLLDGASGNVIGGPTLASRNVISGNLDGIRVMGAATTLNRIEGNIIGLNAAGTQPLPNLGSGIRITDGDETRIGGPAAAPGTPPGNIISGNTLNGIQADTDANRIEGNIIGTTVGGGLLSGNLLNGVSLRGTDNVIGGNAVNLRNLISGNHESGILIAGGEARFNRIEGNFIGVNAAGTAAIPNRTHGVHISGGRNNFIGDGPPGLGNLGIAGLGNLISGNSLSGIMIESPPNEPANIASGNLIQKNQIGVTATGLAALPNNIGISLVETPDNVVGGAAAESANIISGNLTDGVYIKGAGANKNTVQRNIIGLNAAGVLAVKNGANGIRLEGATESLVGGPSPLGNIISGNGAHGILIDGTPAIGQQNAANKVQGNQVGLNVNNAPAANIGDGIQILDSGRNTVGPDNVIAHNQGAGVTVLHNQRGLGNVITANSIHGNGQLGIDLGGDGPSPNDSDDSDAGANRLQNFPDLTAYSGVIQTLFGHLRSTPNTGFLVEIFRNDSADPSGFGEGQTEVDHLEVLTDGQGNAHFAIPLPPPGGDCFTAVAINMATGDTSEFSPCATAQAADLADFGDAPGLQHRTALAANGARHLVNPAVRLGALIDGETDAAINPLNASGDDMDNLADEDGIEFLDPMRYGAPPSRIRVRASVAGFLNGWIDLNANGDFADAGEHLVKEALLSAGTNVLHVTIPAAAAPGTTYARFRFSTVSGLSFFGAAPDGEVEDYQVTIEDSGTVVLAVMKVADGKLRTSWPTKIGWKYQMFFKVNLSDSIWSPIGVQMVGDGTTKTFEDFAGATTRFYLMAITPP